MPCERFVRSKEAARELLRKVRACPRAQPQAPP
jgi:hypothetical protein